MEDRETQKGERNLTMNLSLYLVDNTSGGGSD